jgi:hypothetical protein
MIQAAIDVAINGEDIAFIALMAVFAVIACRI